MTVLARVVSVAGLQHENLSCASEGMLTHALHAVTALHHATAGFQALQKNV